MPDRVVRWAQVVTGVLLLWAALAKLGDLRAFSADVHNFRVVPVALENVVAVALPWIELIAGLALVAGVRARAGAVVAAGLLGLFTLAVVAAIARGLDIECGCFGTADATRVGWVKVAQNVALLAAASVAALGPRGRRPETEARIQQPAGG